MNYINIQLAAKKWNLTPRRVQELCKQGAIEGAVRFGRAWMIPEEAHRPQDGRTRQAREEKQRPFPEVPIRIDQEAVERTSSVSVVIGKAEEGLPHLPMPRKNPILTHTDLYQEPGTADQVVAQWAHQPEVSKILQSQFDYQRGNIDKIYEDAKYFLKAHSGLYAVINAGILLSRCAMWRGDIYLWRQARQHIYEAPCKDETERQVLACWLAITDSYVNDTRDFPEWFQKGRFDGFPADSLSAARVFYAKYLFISAYELASGRAKFKDVNGLGLMRTLPYILEPMASQAKAERTVIPEIYLRLMAATVYHTLGEKEQAVFHLDQAIALCLPDRLYSALVEHRTNLDTLMDERLALVDEEALKKVKELHKKMNEGWVKLHNQLLDRSVSISLTTRERQVAKLAAFGLSNTEIAQRLHIELSSVKSYIFSAMNKVGAEKRTELGAYI